MFQITKNFSSGTRNVVKNIASEIVRECGKQGTTLSAEVASLGVVIFCLDPANKLSLTSQNDRSVLENFVRYCVHKFLGRYLLDKLFFTSLLLLSLPLLLRWAESTG